MALDQPASEHVLKFDSDDYYAGATSIEFNLNGVGAADVAIEVEASGVSASVTYYLMIDDLRELIPKLQEVVDRYDARFPGKGP